MKITIQRWLYGLGSAVVGGGASAVVSGFTAMGFAPDKFNFTTGTGVVHFFALALINFAVSAFLSAMFYLKQSPLPPDDNQN